MTLTEAVARAICAADGIEPDLPERDDFMGRVPGSDGYAKHAKAAILATLEHLKANITPEMTEAGRVAERECDPLPTDSSGRDAMCEVFRAMIDQAIKEMEK